MLAHNSFAQGQNLKSSVFAQSVVSKPVGRLSSRKRCSGSPKVPKASGSQVEAQYAVPLGSAPPQDKTHTHGHLHLLPPHCVPSRSLLCHPSVSAPPCRSAPRIPVRAPQRSRWDCRSTPEREREEGGGAPSGDSNSAKHCFRFAASAAETPRAHRRSPRRLRRREFRPLRCV